MPELIGSVFPLAVGIAVVPVPVIAVVLILMSPRARTGGVAFVVGWMLGLSLAVLLAVLAVTAAEGSDTDSSPRTLLRLALGALLLVLAVRKFREKPGGRGLPGWMTAVDTMPLTRVACLAAALAALNPKNLALVVAAADAASQASAEAGGGATGATVAVVATFFVLVASLSVVGPVAAYLVAPRRMAEPLQRLKEWLVVHHSSVMGTLLLVFAVLLLGQGFAEI